MITAVIYVPALEGVATAGGFILLCGYWYVLILNYLFERKSMTLFLVNGGYHTVQFTLMGLWH